MVEDTIVEEYLRHDTFTVSSDIQEQLVIALNRNRVESKDKLKFDALKELNLKVSNSIEKLQKLTKDWDADTLSLTLPEKLGLVHQIFDSQGYFETYKIEKPIFKKFLSAVHYYYSYKKNPFHNFDHGLAGTFIYYSSMSFPTLLHN